MKVLFIAKLRVLVSKKGKFFAFFCFWFVGSFFGFENSKSSVSLHIDKKTKFMILFIYGNKSY